jgi:hypothetical protein
MDLASGAKVFKKYLIPVGEILWIVTQFELYRLVDDNKACQLLLSINTPYLPSMTGEV